MVGIRARRKAERPGEILEAAFDEFVLNGYAATRLEDVARRVGVTKGTIYFYFGSKEAVFEAAVRTVGALPLKAFNAGRPAFTDDVAEDIRIFLRDLYGFIDANPRPRETLRLLVAEARRFPQAVDAYFTAFMDPVAGWIRSRVELAAARGEIRRDLPSMADVIASPPFGYMVMTLLFNDRRGIDSAQLLRSQFALLSDGWLAQGGPRPSGDDPDQPVSSDPHSDWTTWRSVPDARNGEMLTAPIGPGLYELRLAEGSLICLGSARSVTSRLSALLSMESAPDERGADTRRRFLIEHLGRIEYRTRGCASHAQAQDIARSFDQKTYRFPSHRRAG